MLCPRCYGTHVIMQNGCQVPCPECGGIGEIYCCDGLTEQPDGDGEAAPCPVPDQPLSNWACGPHLPTR